MEPMGVTDLIQDFIKRANDLGYEVLISPYDDLFYDDTEEEDSGTLMFGVEVTVMFKDEEQRDDTMRELPTDPDKIY